MAGAIFSSGAIRADKEVTVADAFAVDIWGELWESFAFLAGKDENALLFPLVNIDLCRVVGKENRSFTTTGWLGGNCRGGLFGLTTL